MGRFDSIMALDLFHHRLCSDIHCQQCWIRAWNRTVVDWCKGNVMRDYIPTFPQQPIFTDRGRSLEYADALLAELANMEKTYERI